MRESIGTTMTINIIIIFITLVFVFIATTLIYHKAFKISKSISAIIEKYEGYNEYARQEISTQLTSIGYSVQAERHCPKSRKDEDGNDIPLVTKVSGSVDAELFDKRYCIYRFEDDAKNYRAYGIITYITIDFPLIADTLYLPVYTKTNRLYKFD